MATCVMRGCPAPPDDPSKPPKMCRRHWLMSFACSPESEGDAALPIDHDPARHSIPAVDDARRRCAICLRGVARSADEWEAARIERPALCAVPGDSGCAAARDARICPACIRDAVIA